MTRRYISDLHLGHTNILGMGKNGELTKRKMFQDISEMNEYIITQWNEHVDADDEVWIAGDLSYRSGIDVGKYLSRMAGHKHLIIGNHDVKWMKNVELSKYFESVSHMEIIKEGSRAITICHYPLMEWAQSRRAKYSLDGYSWLIHGHIHDSTTCDAYRYIKEKPLPCALNAGFDIPGNDYPVTFEELLENNDKWYGRGQAYLE